MGRGLVTMIKIPEITSEELYRLLRRVLLTINPAHARDFSHELVGFSNNLIFIKKKLIKSDEVFEK